MTEMLKYEEAHLVDCRDLDEFVAQFLVDAPVTWRALDTGYDGYHNGSYSKADVAFGEPLDWEGEEANFERWLSGEGPFYLDPDGDYSYDLPGIEEMLQWLCNEGHIQSGRYLVELWW